jgi:hypothetical protein
MDQLPDTIGPLKSFLSDALDMANIPDLSSASISCRRG